MLGTSCMPCGPSTLALHLCAHQGLHLSLMHRAAEADLQGASMYYVAYMNQHGIKSVSAVVRYKQLHQDYALAPYLSTVKNLRNRTLISRFRCGCHGLHVDTGRFLPVGQKVLREQRFCLVCGSNTAEDEHHFLFDCPAYCHIRNNFDAIFWGPAPTLSSFFALHDPKVIGRFLKECFALRNTLLSNYSFWIFSYFRLLVKSSWLALRPL